MQKEVDFIVASVDNYMELAYFNKQLIDSGGSYNKMSIQELERRMHNFLSSEEYIAIIFEVDKMHIGYALIEIKKEPMFVRHFFIMNEFRRKGYGSTAFRQLIDFLEVDKIDLSVLVSNHIGFEFWLSCGARPYEVLMHYRQNT